MSFINNLVEKVKKIANKVVDANEAAKIENCAEDDPAGGIPEKDKIKSTDTTEDRKDKTADMFTNCGLNVSHDDKDDKSTSTLQEPCESLKSKLLMEDMGDIMGNGIDETVPSQEGFIPPHCYEYAQTIIEAVRNAQNTNNSYNSTAIYLDEIVKELRDFHEVSKFMVTVQDNSEGSKKLMENTTKNPKYNQIFMNKDVLDFRDSILNIKRK